MARKILFAAIALGAFSITASAAPNAQSDLPKAPVLHDARVHAGETAKFCIEEVCKPRKPKATVY
jgi:hypothetical protein